jgi:hypothetical protein
MMFSMVGLGNTTGLAFMEEELAADCEAAIMCSSVTPMDASPGKPL